MPKSFFKKVIKIFQSQIIYQNSGFAALCSEVIFCVFMKKKVDALFQKWTFSECPFLGYMKHFLFLCFF